MYSFMNCYFVKIQVLEEDVEIFINLNTSIKC